MVMCPFYQTSNNAFHNKKPFSSQKMKQHLYNQRGKLNCKLNPKDVPSYLCFLIFSEPLLYTRCNVAEVNKCSSGNLFNI